MSCVTIGDGVVIANNSHVVKNTKPYSLIGVNDFIEYYYQLYIIINLNIYYK
jgi:acetyltransferase-like isoleucine patch superfamily enzyme